MDELQKIRMRMLQKFMKKDTQEMPTKPIRIGENDFNEFVSKYNVVVADFWAPWCQPCKIVEPMIAKLAREMKGKVAFAKINSDINRKLSLKYRVMSIPTLLLFKNGRLIERQVGVIPMDMLRVWVGRYI